MSYLIEGGTNSFTAKPKATASTSTSTALAPTRTATQDWTVLAQRPDKPVTLTAPPAVPVTSPPSTTTQTPTNTGIEIPIHVDPGRIYEPDQGGGQISSPSTFDQNTLNTLLASLEAQYGLSREQLMADQTEVGNMYRFVMNNINQLQQQAGRANTESSLGRGILRSGIHLENEANINADFAGRAAQAEAEKARNLQYIQQGLGQLESQYGMDRMQKAQGFGQRGLEHERALAAAQV